MPSEKGSCGEACGGSVGWALGDYSIWIAGVRMLRCRVGIVTAWRYSVTAASLEVREVGGELVEVRRGEGTVRREKMRG